MTETGAARHAILVAIPATLIIAAAPVFNPGGGYVRAALAAVLVGLVLLAQLAPGDSFERHDATCNRCRCFEGGCKRWARLVEQAKARGEWMAR